VIGEWARDKLTRYSLLTGNGDPWSGTSARRRAPSLYAPWLPKPDHCRAGLNGLRGAIPPDNNLFERRRRRRSSDVLARKGVADMPLGVDVVEPPMPVRPAGARASRCATASRSCSTRARSSRHRRDHAAQHGRGDGRRRLPGHLRGAQARHPRERDRGARDQALYEMGSDCVEAINAIAGERCSPHPHNFTDRMIRPGDQAFFDIIQSFMGYRTCYYRTFNVGRATPAQHDAYKKAREWIDARSS
jgi:Xaa-Pro aminopeptidase